MKRVVILNGPPQSGKDDGAKFLAERFNGHHQEFKAQLFSLTKLIWNIKDDAWDRMYERDLKEEPTELLGGMSPRGSLIHTSETVIKPNYGREYFGKCAARLLEDGVTFFSDGGFVEEVRPMLDTIGEENVLIIRLYRPGYTFEGDSRDWLPHNLTTNMIDLHNDGSFDEYLQKLETEVATWLSAF